MLQKSYHGINDLLISQFTFIVTEERTRKIGFIILATDNVSIIFPACDCDETRIAQCNENIPLAVFQLLTSIQKLQRAFM